MVSPANEHHRVGVRVVWHEARSPEGLTYRELFSNFLPVNLEEWPASSGRYFRRMLHHLVSGPQTQWRADWGDLVMARQRIELAPEEAEELSRRARATTVSVRDRRRAEIIVLSAQGLTQQRIAEQLGSRRPACSACGRPVTSSRISRAPSNS
jgi:hypothetical protein